MGDLLLPSGLEAGAVVEGPALAEPVRLAVVAAVGDRVRVVGEGLRTGRFHQLLLDKDQLAELRISPAEGAYDGDPIHFRLGIEAQRLALAHEYDPYFSLSISRAHSPGTDTDGTGCYMTRRGPSQAEKPDDPHEWDDAGWPGVEGLRYRTCIQLWDAYPQEKKAKSKRVCSDALRFPDEFVASSLDPSYYAFAWMLLIGGVEVDGGGWGLPYGGGPPMPIDPLGWRRPSPKSSDSLLAVALRSCTRLFADSDNRRLIEEATSSIFRNTITGVR